MAVLANGDRRECWAEFMRDLSLAGEPLGLSKADLRAAFDDLDDWVHANQATLNTAIPQPARGAMTASQKSRLYAAVFLKRFARGA